ncbi:hypothetical protein WN51_03106 [Melipona quadrifasciata]|uniref:Uncharacterized protein n=1 Tax=Melipona quadrifasciata TaxID=166423 RepID=A0A0N0BEX6_9HYME|nr:hypothetical protein WN51_03106 [Melipona quadrifasciata]
MPKIIKLLQRGYYNEESLVRNNESIAGEKYNWGSVRMLGATLLRPK